jgi:formylmethanofuran dehydrogenase subunit D
MFRFGKFIKKAEAEVVIARNLFYTIRIEENKFDNLNENSAIIYLNNEFAKMNGFREGETLRLSTSDRAINLRVKISDDAGKPTIPNSIFSSFLVNFNSFKRFRATLEVTDLPPTKPLEIINMIETYDL